MSAIRTMTNYNTQSFRRNQGATPEQVAFGLANDAERRSIHVANLPVGITESQIRDLFARFGPINQIEIREYRSRYERKSIPIPFFACLANISQLSPLESLLSLSSHLINPSMKQSVAM